MTRNPPALTTVEMRWRKGVQKISLHCNILQLVYLVFDSPDAALADCPPSPPSLLSKHRSSVKRTVSDTGGKTKQRNTANQTKGVVCCQVYLLASHCFPLSFVATLKS